MKKLVSILLAASMMLAGSQAFAQVSVNAGYLNSTLAVQDLDPTNSNGGYVGLSFHLPLAGSLAVAPGIYYSFLGGKQDIITAGSWAKVDATFAEHAVNAPILLNYGIDLARDTRFFVYAGPTLQYIMASDYQYKGNSSVLTDLLNSLGISGKAEGTTTVDNCKQDDFNRFNVYLGGGIGINVNAFQITLGYDYGMLNQFTGDDAQKAHRSNLKIGVGYAF